MLVYLVKTACHNGPTAGSGRPEVDNGAVNNILGRYKREDEKLPRNMRLLIEVSCAKVSISLSFNKTHMHGCFCDSGALSLFNVDTERLKHNTRLLMYFVHIEK